MEMEYYLKRLKEIRGNFYILMSDDDKIRKKAI